MNILMLNYEYPPIGSGGGIITRNISEGLVKSGNKVTVITTFFPQEQGKSDSSPADPKSNPEIIRLKSRRKNTYYSNPLEMLSWIRAAKAFLGTWQKIGETDLCFAHFSLPGGEVALWAKKKFNIPYVVMSHGHDIPWVHPRKMFFFHLACWYRIRQICLGSAVNFIQTKTMKSNIDRFLGKRHSGKNIIIPNGINPELFHPDYTKRAPHLKILFVGRLVSQKDPFTFLRAVKLLSMKNPDFTVEIFGDGPLRHRMERYCGRHRLDRIVRFMGKQSEEEMVRAFQSSHLLVATSLNEGMSISMMEGIACGLYVITTPVSGCDVLIKESINGNMVSFGDYQGVFSAMNDFVTEKFAEDYRVPSAFIDGFCQEYNWTRIAAGYQERLEYFLM